MSRWTATVALALLMAASGGCDRKRPQVQSQWPGAWPTAATPYPYAPPAPGTTTTSDEPIPRAAATAIPKPAAPEPMIFAVQLDTRRAATKDQRVRVTLSAPGRGELWACARNGPLSDERLDTWCPMSAPWAASGGVYTVAVRYSEGNVEHETTQPVQVSGAELELEVRVLLDSNMASPQLFVTRVSSAPQQFRLERKFTRPWHPGLPLRYRVVNGDATRTIVAPAVKGHLLGALEHKSGGRWVPHGRGVTCDVTHGTSELLAGATGEALEGHFVGELRPLEPGQYRFRLRFRDAGAPAGDGGVQQVYELRDRIQVSNMSQRPSDPGVNCDSPFSIDRWGLRRVKPECL